MVRSDYVYVCEGVSLSLLCSREFHIPQVSAVFLSFDLGDLRCSFFIKLFTDTSGERNLVK